MIFQFGASFSLPCVPSAACWPCFSEKPAVFRVPRGKETLFSNGWIKAFLFLAGRKLKARFFFMWSGYLCFWVLLSLRERLLPMEITLGKWWKPGILFHNWTWWQLMPEIVWWWLSILCFMRKPHQEWERRGDCESLAESSVLWKTFWKSNGRDKCGVWSRWRLNRYNQIEICEQNLTISGPDKVKVVIHWSGCYQIAAKGWQGKTYNISADVYSTGIHRNMVRTFVQLW